MTMSRYVQVCALSNLAVNDDESSETEWSDTWCFRVLSGKSPVRLRRPKKKVLRQRVVYSAMATLKMNRLWIAKQPNCKITHVNLPKQILYPAMGLTQPAVSVENQIEHLDLDHPGKKPEDYRKSLEHTSMHVVVSPTPSCDQTCRFDHFPESHVWLPQAKPITGWWFGTLLFFPLYWE